MLDDLIDRGGMITDLDRLHDVAEGRLTGRGVGATFYHCHQVAGAIELGERNVYIQVPVYRDVDYIMLMLKSVLSEHGIEIIKEVEIGRYGFTVGHNTLVRFVTYGDVAKDKLRGCEGFIVDMHH